MPWLIFRGEDDWWLKARCRNQWTNETKSAAKFRTKEEAERVAKHYQVPGELFFIELSCNDIYRRRATPREAISARQRQREQTRLAEEAAEMEVEDLPYRTLAVRLLFGADMPEGISNPYYVGAACSGDRREYGKRRRVVDTLAQMLKSGEAQPPRYADGTIALPQPRKTNENALRFLAMESPNSNWMARVNRKKENRRE